MRALLLLAATAHAAHADPVALPRTKATLDVPKPWTRVERPDLVAGYRSDTGILLAITRAQLTNVDAYRTPARAAYLDQIERGIASRVPGYRRVARSLADAHGTPALDLEAKRGDGATIVVRVLLFWTYALALAIEVPRGASAAPARAIAATFSPPA